MKTNREEILQHALRLFMSMNYESVSLQMIAHSVGLTKTGIFNYYPSKLDLFIAVADHYLFHLQDPGNKFAPSDGSLCDFIDKYVEGVERTMAEIVRLGNIRPRGDARTVGQRRLLSPLPTGTLLLSRRQAQTPRMDGKGVPALVRGYQPECRAGRTASRYRRRGSRRTLPAGFHRTIIPDVF